MKFLNKVYSKTDNVVKYIFEYKEQIVELSYIDNGTGKDIICVPTHTMCNLGCKFCHTTDYIGKILIYELNDFQILLGIDYIYKDLKLCKETLLISYMGCGEPFNLSHNLGTDLSIIYNKYSSIYKTVRFGIATCLPSSKVKNFFDFCYYVKHQKLPVKLHLSLHFVFEEQRKHWMPNSLDIKSSITAIDFYNKYTGNNIEIHYTLIEDVNDDVEDAIELNNLLSNTNFNIKLITYNEKDTLNVKKSTNKNWFSRYVSLWNREVEIYTPPGRDISSSCGMLSLEENYKKYKLSSP